MHGMQCQSALVHGQLQFRSRMVGESVEKERAKGSAEVSDDEEASSLTRGVKQTLQHGAILRRDFRIVI
jgi:hypothetical protein